VPVMEQPGRKRRGHRVGLTGRQNTSNLIAVSLAKPILLALLVVTLAAYAFDCGAATNPEQAMQCCNSMPCSSGGHHGQDCCKTMPAMHAPFVQPSSVHGVSYSSLVFELLPATSDSIALGASNRMIAALISACAALEMNSSSSARCISSGASSLSTSPRYFSVSPP